MYLPGFALCRALLRQVPHISLPGELTSRPGWINPIRYLILSGFRRNKNDTSPRLVTSALLSGYRMLTLLTDARDASSPSHTELLTFLLDRHRAFPAYRAPPPPPPPPAPKPPPLLTKVSSPGELPLYASTVRPLPLDQISGGKRKVPKFEMAQNVPFLRVGKPQSHAHAAYMRVKIARRQNRITALMKMTEEEYFHYDTEDEWDAEMRRLAREEGVELDMDEDEPHPLLYKQVLRASGVDHLKRVLEDEVEDMQARATTMLDIIEEEEKLAKLEKQQSDERRRQAWEERVKLGKDEPSSRAKAPEHLSSAAEGVKGSQDSFKAAFEGAIKNDWVTPAREQRQLKVQNKASRRPGNPTKSRPPR